MFLSEKKDLDEKFHVLPRNLPVAVYVGPRHGAAQILDIRPVEVDYINEKR